MGGQYGQWHDPHNNGTYVVDSATANELKIHRRTGDNKYTDKMVLSLSTSGSSCLIEACSESQVDSYEDYGTNYCDLRMLYCGSADGCHPVVHDFSSPEGQTKGRTGGSQTGLSNCLKVRRRI